MLRNITGKIADLGREYWAMQRRAVFRDWGPWWYHVTFSCWKKSQHNHSLTTFLYNWNTETCLSHLKLTIFTISMQRWCQKHLLSSRVQNYLTSFLRFSSSSSSFFFLKISSPISDRCARSLSLLSWGPSPNKPEITEV